MNCGEFRNAFPDRLILAFLVDDFTHIIKFKSELITYFMRKFAPEEFPGWRKIYFYSVKHEHDKIIEGGKITSFEEKATFLYLVASRKEQGGPKSVIRTVMRAPDMRLMEGKKAKVITIHSRQ